MSFTSRRGRPKALPANDPGTTQLQSKRVQNLTKEPIDLCLERGIITKDEHWAAMHFRWLYTIRYGAPGISAVNIEFFYGRELKLSDAAWQEMREKEFNEAINSLRKIKAHKIILNVAVFNQRPEILKPGLGRNIIGKSTQIRKIREGLRELAKLWKN